MLEAQKLTYQSYFSQSAELTRGQVASKPLTYLAVSEMVPTVISLDGSQDRGSGLEALSTVYYDRKALDALIRNMPFQEQPRQFSYLSGNRIITVNSGDYSRNASRG